MRSLRPPALYTSLLICGLCATASPSRVAAQGQTVRVQSTDGPVVLRRITGSHSTVVRTAYGSAYAYSESRQTLCQSPCSVRLPYGTHRVSIATNGGTYGNWNLRINGPTDLTFSRVSRRGRRIFRALFGLATMAAGGVVMWRGLALPLQSEGFDAGMMSVRAMVLTSVGGALSALGLTLTILTGRVRDRWSMRA